jgi:hypothetical protein
MLPYGYSPSKSQFVWGMRLVVICDPKGVSVGYELIGPKTGEERESVLALVSAHPESLLFCDRRLWGAHYGSSMELIDVELITSDKHRLESAHQLRSRKPGSSRATNRSKLTHAL